MPMTARDIAQHNQTSIELTASDGIPRLTWEQHGAAFDEPVRDLYAVGDQVAAWDSSTPGTVVDGRDGKYQVRFGDIKATLSYSPKQLRPWPLEG